MLLYILLEHNWPLTNNLLTVFGARCVIILHDYETRTNSNNAAICRPFIVFISSGGFDSSFWEGGGILGVCTV